MSDNDRVIVAGSGLAAAATARAIAVAGLEVALIDERAAVSGTAGDETEWYSSWWPSGDEPMARFAELGIDRLEAVHTESGGGFGFGRGGQLFVSRRPEVIAALRSATGKYASLDTGQLREHATADWYLPSPREGFTGVPDGFDILEGHALRAVFPFLGPGPRVGFHVRRAGLIDGRALRRWLLTAVRTGGSDVLVDNVVAIESRGEGQWAVSLSGGQVVEGRAVVMVGPRSRVLARRTGVEMDWLEGVRVVGRLAAGEGLLPPGAPMVVSADHVPSLWDRGRATELAPELGLAVPSVRPAGPAVLLETIAPAGTRPDQLTGIAEETLRSLAEAIPDLARRPALPGSLSITSGPLSATGDLRPSVGMVDRRGGYLVAGLGAGVTFVMAAADLVAAQLAGKALPRYAPAFVPGRGLEGRV